MTATTLNLDTLAITGIKINQDAQGRYCLNDLHKAAGGEDKHRPTYWLKLQQTIDLSTLLDSEKSIDGIPSIVTKQGLGTFVVKELVYAYATWISAKFFLTVVRAYDALVNTKPTEPEKQMFKPRPHTTPLHPTMMTVKMKAHIQHVINASVHETNQTTNRVVIDLANHFYCDAWEMIPMAFYEDVCAYFEVQPLYKVQSTNAWSMVETVELNRLRLEHKDNYVIPRLEADEMSLPESRYLELVAAEAELKEIKARLETMAKDRDEGVELILDVVEKMKDKSTARIIVQGTYLITRNQ